MQPVDLGGEHGTALSGEAVETAGFVIGERGFRRVDDELLVHESLEIVVEGAGAKFVMSVGLARDLLDDAVTVEVFGGERQEDVKHGGGERRAQIGIWFHGRNPTISDSDYMASFLGPRFARRRAKAIRLGWPTFKVTGCIQGEPAEGGINRADESVHCIDKSWSTEGE